MRKLTKIASGALAAVMVFSAAAIAPAASAKTQSVTRLGKPAKFKAKLSVPDSTFGILDRGVKLTWKKVKNAKKYEIYRAKITAKGKVKYKRLASVKKAKYTDDAIDSGKYYKYKVRAVSGKVKSKFTSPTKKVGYMAPPLTTVEMSDTCDSVQIEWTTCVGASGYKIYKSTNNGKSYKLLKKSKSFKYKDGSYYYKDKNVKLGGLYSYYVVAYNSKLKSPKGNTGRVVFKDYHYSVQVGKTRSSGVTYVPTAGLEDILTIKSENESVLKAKLTTNSSGATVLNLTGVKTGYAYIKLNFGTDGVTLMSRRLKIKVTDGPAYDYELKKGASSEIYELDNYKLIADMYKALGLNAKIKVSASSSNPNVAAVTNPGSLNMKIKGVAEGEAVLKVKISVKYTGKTQLLSNEEYYVKVNA